MMPTAERSIILVNAKAIQPFGALPVVTSKHSIAERREIRVAAISMRSWVITVLLRPINQDNQDNQNNRNNRNNRNNQKTPTRHNQHPRRRDPMKPILHRRVPVMVLISTDGAKETSQSGVLITPSGK